MSIGVTRIHHAQLTVSRTLEGAAKRFYGEILRLPEIAKPTASRKRGGAWYRVGSIELHVSIEDIDRTDNERSKRHVCLMVADLSAAERSLRSAGIDILADLTPEPGWKRFYVRDPGGNRLEIAEEV